MSKTKFNRFVEGVEEIRSSWGWFLVLGILSIVLGAGCIGFDVSATFATVLVFGWFLLIGGVIAFMQAFRTGTWRGFLLHLLSAILRGVTGYMLIRYPLMGAETLTLVLASFFMVGGVFRAVGSAARGFLAGVGPCFREWSQPFSESCCSLRCRCPACGSSVSRLASI